VATGRHQKQRWLVVFWRGIAVGLTLVVTVGPWGTHAAPVNPFSIEPPFGANLDQSGAPADGIGGMPTHDLPPRALPANGGVAATAFLDATTEDRQLVGPGRFMPLPPVAEQPLFRAPGAKQGVLQYAGFTKTLLLGGAGDNIRFLDLAVKATLGFPFPSRQSPLLASPGFTAHLIDGPTTEDLPGHLFDSFLELRWLNFLSPQFTLDTAFIPGIYGDYAFVNASTWRYQGRIVGIWTCNPATQLVAGLAYLDREDVRFLPVAGLIWTPNDIWRFELVAPRPRIACQLCGDSRRQWWLYLGGEFGGNSYSILRTNGLQDVATYRDLRLLLGAERKKLGGRTLFWEAGYVFDRKLEYKSGTPTIFPGPTALLRAGAFY
jgi:hypothetical protein